MNSTSLQSYFILVIITLNPSYLKGEMGELENKRFLYVFRSFEKQVAA
ncbi:MAG: hypothetical protein FGF53_07820 [Candidatus Brockarchaeota archaeon]|nr:hypothetical protein [Candidatus Brockarchaeota archaeon]